MRRAAKVDSNQTEIVNALRGVGATVLLTHQLKNAFDLLVGYRGQLFIVEVKDGKKVPSKRKLTDGETGCKADFERVGVAYHIVESTEQALKLIGATT